MKPEDPVCLCFHVTHRKVISFIRVEKPKRPSQLSQCFGAGTGCGWCRPYLERIMAKELESQHSTPNSDRENDPNQADLDAISIQDYARNRAKYVLDGGGKPPPGAVPIDKIEPESGQ